MIVDVTLPKVGMTSDDADVSEWMVGPGEAVAVGDALVQIETDKASTVIEAEVAGTIVEIVAEDGSTVESGAVLCRIETQPGA